MASEYGYAIVKVIKDLGGGPTDVLVDVVGYSSTKEMALRVAKAKTDKSYNYVYLIKKVRRY